jgi:hypothetical protein
MFFMIATTARGLTISLIVTLSFALLALASAAKAGERVRVCHYTESESNPTVEIVISYNALQNHLDHGDAVYDPINGCEEGGADPQ